MTADHAIHALRGARDGRQLVVIKNLTLSCVHMKAETNARTMRDK
jgi:hypothetical protein